VVRGTKEETNKCLERQAAHVIRGFCTRGFDYLWSWKHGLATNNERKTQVQTNLGLNINGLIWYLQ